MAMAMARMERVVVILVALWRCGWKCSGMGWDTVGWGRQILYHDGTPSGDGGHGETASIPAWLSERLQCWDARPWRRTAWKMIGLASSSQSVEVSAGSGKIEYFGP